MYESHVSFFLILRITYVFQNVTADLIVAAQNDVSLCLKIVG